MQNQHNKTKQSGFSLLETLLALGIFGFAALALANLATTAWKRSYDAHLATIATISANNRVEALYAGDNQHYHRLWLQNVTQTLPHGKGESSGTKKNKFKVEVCWQQLFKKQNYCYQLKS
jgi:prepilin-type N-terminal cleavage/methylation domain-containing protein